LHFLPLLDDRPSNESIVPSAPSALPRKPLSVLGKAFAPIHSLPRPKHIPARAGQMSALTTEFHVGNRIGINRRIYNHRTMN